MPSTDYGSQPETLKRRTLPEETWKPVVGYEGLYEVSNLGRVKSLKRFHVKERILSYCINKQGYKRVNLWKGNSQKKYSIHRLVAMAFVDNPNPDSKIHVNHIDENKQNNCADNLEWVTPVENHNHGTINQRIAVHLQNNSKKSKAVIGIDSFGNVTEFPSANEASRITGIFVACIRDCLHGRTKHAGGMKWQFKN